MSLDARLENVRGLFGDLRGPERVTLRRVPSFVSVSKHDDPRKSPKHQQHEPRFHGCTSPSNVHASAFPAYARGGTPRSACFFGLS